MKSLTELCDKHFNCTSLYDVLGVDRDVGDAAIKRAYYKKSLKVHPDRVNEDEKENATEKFQTLSKVYSILGDQEKRRIYDETGCVDDDDFLKGDVNWEDYWRLLFKKVTEQDITEFENKYKGSEEETLDVKQLYERYKGDMDNIMSSVLCATTEDEPRIRDIIQKMVDNDEVPSYKAFTSEPKKKRDARKKKGEREAKMAEKMAEELGLTNSLDGSEDSLRSLIQKRNMDRAASANNFFSALEAKYGGKTSKKQSTSKRKEKNESNDDSEEEEVLPQRSKKGRVSKK
ncbi:dnaJ homolog subfamily C member 9 [Daphnia magna]|uniref:dnaJ homolog subfamily C member 9 n=1 Tax=Daphnia magna TaxID=35525 RepID=UPI0006DE0B6E|nr:dnaJ homolog subfamily C member 9 [Daphnia magna]